MDCEHIKGCIFFNDRMAVVPATAEIFKIVYCRGHRERCARFIVRQALGKESVPPDLFPNQVEQAKAIMMERRISRQPLIEKAAIGV